MMEKDEKMVMETAGQDFFQMGSFHDYIKLPEGLMGYDGTHCPPN